MKYYLLFLIGFGLLHFSPAKGEEIKLYADKWCPYNCEANSAYEGYLVDMARAIFEPKGHRITYDTIPWARTLALASRYEHVAALGAYKDDGKDLVFHKNPAGLSIVSFLVSANSNWTYFGYPSLRKVKLGVIKGYTYGQELDRYIHQYQDDIFFLHGANALEQGLKMLDEGRLTVLIDDQNVLRETAKKLGMVNRFKFAGSMLPGNNVYIAFSSVGQAGKLYARQFSEGIADLRKSGQLHVILRKYGLEDWAE